MNIDTETVKRLRDALLARAREGAAALQPVAENPAARGRQAALARVAPFIETMYLMMIVDGAVDLHEQAILRGASLALTDGLVDDTLLDSLLQRCREAVEEQGVEQRLQAIGGRICASRADRELAFSLAAAVAMADDSLAEEESLLVGDIAEWFGLSSRRCRELLEQL